ncbi:MAG: SET domain-containing protein-lysine N-methyltransferase, partial [Balneolaceae bacterium]
MIHPHTELRFVNQKKGRGVFATRFILKGTITYVKDELEIEIPPDDPRLADPAYRDIIETYSYIDRDGTMVISWDHAKYVNHCCQCNTMSTGYGFEIAI